MCPILIFLSLYLSLFTILHDIKATVTYNPNDKTITVENVRNPIFRLICCKSKVLAQTYAINRISSISNIKGCCFYKFSVVSLGQFIVQTDEIFGQSELSPIIEVIKPTIDAIRLLEAQQRAAAIAPPPQQIIIVVQNAEEYLRANPNAQVQIVQQGNYNPTSILPIQQQQPIMQFPNQQEAVSYPTTVPEYSQIATKQ
ncbi:MAG: hypothetical protein EZS28_002235 [Streblomastix strix]|uniref:Uncharacterized protein n=1 Tax=Streblomastix strix TaxID=222440 RepID=A0A5J4X5Y2_9EUKA|nr:MAG: hypothetical protein EZS28_002235 [Streblomastix strix]